MFPMRTGLQEPEVFWGVFPEPKRVCPLCGGEAKQMFVDVVQKRVYGCDCCIEVFDIEDASDWMYDEEDDDYE